MTPPNPSAETLLLLDLHASSFHEALEMAEARIAADLPFTDSARAELHRTLHRLGDSGAETVRNTVAIEHAQVTDADLFVQALVRLSSDADVETRDGDHVRFLWLLLSPEKTHEHLDSAIGFARFMGDPAFREGALAAGSYAELEAVYQASLHHEVALGEHPLPPELEPTGRLFGGFVADIRRRLPHYASDYLDGLNTKTLASVFFLFFACVAPTIAFGGLLTKTTNGAIGAVEMLLGTGLCGVVYALFSGQPLTILGATGPVIIFMGLLYQTCERLGIPFTPTMSWVGLWTAAFVLILAFTDASSLIRYFTRFTDDTFAALISIIFVWEALLNMGRVFTDHEVSHDTALLSLVLFLGTYGLARALGRFRASLYLRRAIREFIADFGPAIAIASMAGVAFLLQEVELQTLVVPERFGTTSGRPWLVNPFEAPRWVWFASAIPALLAAILLYLDQNITVRLVNNNTYRLQKGAGYHLDLALVGLMVGVCSMFGLPWVVAATVRSLNHVRSLAKVESAPGERGASEERIVGVVETRLSALGVHGLMVASLLFLPALALVPMSVLFGLFLFMGVASMSGNQLFERLKLIAMDPTLYPTTSYLRAVPTGTVHRFTAIQTGALAALWVVKTSAVGILFPLFIGLLVPLRMVLGRWFRPEHLALLDAEEEPGDEETRETE